MFIEEIVLSTDVSKQIINLRRQIKLEAAGIVCSQRGNSIEKPRCKELPKADWGHRGRNKVV